MLSDSTRAVIERLVEACVVGKDSVQTALARNPQIQQYHHDYAKLAEAITEARKLLADDGWIRIEDALPVVPDPTERGATMTPEQLEIAARKLCELRGEPNDGLAEEIARHQIRMTHEINEAIKYALEQP